MDSWKKVLQVVASIAYTAIYSGVFCALFYFLAKWMITLQPWLMMLLLVALLVLSIMRGGVLISLLLLLAPYQWIIENNKASLYISAYIYSTLMFLLIGIIWNLDYNGWGLAVVIVFTIVILFLTFISVRAMFKFYNNESLFD